MHTQTLSIMTQNKINVIFYATIGEPKTKLAKIEKNLIKF